jgi:DNA-binding GntR family transcriptional regulator
MRRLPHRRAGQRTQEVRITREHGGSTRAEAATPIVRPAKLSQLAADLLRERILRGQLAPGSPLAQDVLAREFGISRTPLRDALKVLERDGLIQLDGIGSATVADPKDEDARDLLLIREVIDSVAARRAASLADPARRQLSAILEPIVTELADAAADEDRYRFRLADSHFHVAILRHCGLDELERCQAFVHTTALSMYAVRPPSPGHLSEASQQHDSIGTAIVSGDLSLSARLAAEHVRHAYEYYYRDWPPTGTSG